MPQLSYRNVLEGYALEVAARAESGRQRCKQLATSDFVSSAPQNLVQALQNAFDYLAAVIPVITSNIDWSSKPEELENDITALRVLDVQLKRFAAEIRYVDSARTNRQPWEVIPSFEKLVQDIRPEAQVMLRPMWRYNYATMVTNLRERYRSRLQGFTDYLPHINIDSVLKPLGSAFHIVSFPAVERDNILLHPLIGHEIGHLIANALVKADENDFLKKVHSQIEAVTDAELAKNKKEYEKLSPLVQARMRVRRRNENSDRCITYWLRALEEILSDIVGVVLFGPAALFSTLEFAIQIGLDLPPTNRNNNYPPWRTRIREVLKAVEELAPELLDVNETLFKMDCPVGLESFKKTFSLSSSARAKLVNDRVGIIRDIVASSADKKEIEKDPLARIAYSAIPEYITKHTQSIKEKIGNRSFVKKRVIASLPALIERLDAGITPNAIHDKPSKRAPQIGLVEVLNSAWYHKASLSLSGTNPDVLPHLEQLRSQRNRLTLKSIEYTFLSQSYRRKKRSKHRVPTADDFSSGVLTSDDLQEWMEKDSILERLIVTPLLDSNETIGESAIDIRLGTEFVLFRKETFQSLDVTSDTLVSEISRYQHRVVRPIGRTFVLHPRQLVISSTLEYVYVPPTLLAYVIGKSTWGRTGLIIATATKVDPGFKGSITLEIVNEGEVPLVLVPGIPIAQLVFHRTQQPAHYKGVYSSPIGPEFPRFEKLIASSSYWLTRNRKQKRKLSD